MIIIFYILVLPPPQPLNQVYLTVISIKAHPLEFTPFPCVVILWINQFSKRGKGRIC